MRIEVALFGPLREQVGKAAIEVNIDSGACVDDLLAAIAEPGSSLGASLASSRVAINRSFAKGEEVIMEGDEVAIIPPVSGGSTACAHDSIFNVAETDREMQMLRESLTTGLNAFTGAVCLFEGRVRAENAEDEGELLALEYEVYRPMAGKVMTKLAERAVSRWGILNCSVVHRAGQVMVGELVVVIGVAARHRREAFAACEFLTDSLKADLPVWKRELWASGAAVWVQQIPEQRNCEYEER